MARTPATPSASLFQAQQREHFAVVPPFGIRGSISQFDDAIVRKTIDGGISIEAVLNVGAAKSATASVVRARPQRADHQRSRRRVGCLVAQLGDPHQGRQGHRWRGHDPEVRHQLQHERGPAGGPVAVAAHAVELAAIELVGRLARVPYWSCLGATDADAAVQSEITDWYDAMAANPAELIEYFQRQLRARKVYFGRTDGVVNEDFKEALALVPRGPGTVARSEVHDRVLPGLPAVRPSGPWRARCSR
jgi:hypothetical protein